MYLHLQYCWGMGGYLVELESSAEEHDIRQYLPSGNHYWIGTIQYSTIQYSTVQYYYWDRPQRPGAGAAVGVVQQPPGGGVHQLAGEL